MKKYTIETLKEKYWQFKNEQTIKPISGGEDASYTYFNYPDTIEGFIMWLESFENK